MLTTGDTIRIIRAVYNINQSELAKRSGIQQTLISAIEGGRRKATASLPAIETALGVSLSDPAITAAITQLREAICGHTQPS